MQIVFSWLADCGHRPYACWKDNFQLFFYISESLQQQCDVNILINCVRTRSEKASEADLTMGDNGIDPYGSSDFTYGIIVVAAVLHLFIIFIVFYAMCKNNRCQCCVIHRHDNNITVVAQRNPGSTLRSTSGSQTNLIGNTTSRTGLNRQTSLLGNERTHNCDDTEGLPPPYEETGERSHGAINEGFISVELPSYEEYQRDFPPLYDGGSPPKYDDVVHNTDEE